MSEPTLTSRALQEIAGMEEMPPGAERAARKLMALPALLAAFKALLEEREALRRLSTAWTLEQVRDKSSASDAALLAFIGGTQ